MKKNINTFAKVIIIMALALLLFAACGRGGNGNEEAPPSTPVIQDNGTEEAPHIFGIHQPRDFGGKEFTFGAWWDAGIWQTWPWDEPDPATSGNYIVDRKLYDNARRVEREFNIVFVDAMTPHGYMIPNITASVLAGAPIMDIATLSGTMQLSAVTGDLLVPLDTINLPNSDLLGPQIYTRIQNPGFGHYWSFIYNQPSLHVPILGVNLDLINATGAPNPVDLFNEGRWNWDTMLEVMRMTTRDTTGDGTIDQFGLSGPIFYIARNLMAGNDGILMTDDFNYGMDHPNTIETLEFMETIISEGLWENDGSDSPDLGWGGNFYRHRDGNSALFIVWAWALGDGLPYEWAVVPFPTGPSGTSGNTSMDGWAQGHTFVTGSSWAPADLLMVVEEIHAWPGNEVDLLVAGAISSGRATFPTDDDIYRVFHASATIARDLGINVYGYGGVVGRIIENMFNREFTLMQAVETFRPEFQERLDAVFRP